MAERTSPARFAALDGLRGVAAMVVVVGHTLAPFDPVLGRLLVSIPFRPVHWLYDGRLAVYVFWVLSGFVIAQSATRMRRPLAALLLLRWARLGIPMAAAVIFAAALGLSFRDAVIGIRVHEVYSPFYDPMNFAWRSILRQAAGSAFLGRGFPPLDPALWTMHVELIGSCAVYIFYRFSRSSIRVYVLPAITILFLVLGKPGFAAIAAGAFMRELWTLDRVRVRWPVGVLLFGLSLTLFIPPVYSIWADTVYWATASAILFAVLASARLQSSLLARPCQFLGRVSFPLYLVHSPVTMTVGALIDGALGETPIAGAITFPLVVLLSLVLAYLGTVAVDEPLLRTLHRFPKRDAPAWFVGLWRNPG